MIAHYYCRSRRHAWPDPRDAIRCCDPRWRRTLALAGQEQHLDKRGRLHIRCGPVLLIYGWARAIGSQSPIPKYPTKENPWT